MNKSIHCTQSILAAYECTLPTHSPPSSLSSRLRPVAIALRTPELQLAFEGTTEDLTAGLHQLIISSKRGVTSVSVLSYSIHTLIQLTAAYLTCPHPVTPLLWWSLAYLDPHKRHSSGIIIAIEHISSTATTVLYPQSATMAPAAAAKLKPGEKRTISYSNIAVGGELLWSPKLVIRIQRQVQQSCSHFLLTLAATSVLLTRTARLARSRFDIL